MRKITSIFKKDFFQKGLFPLLMMTVAVIAIPIYIIFAALFEILGEIGKRLGFSFKPVIVGSILILSSCSTSNVSQDFVPYWQHYDECSKSYAQFSKMVSCGKQKRLEGCEGNVCEGARGNAFMDYSDSLVSSVKSGQFNEDEAKRRWIEFRLKEEDAYNQDRNAMLNRRALHSQRHSPTATQCHTVNGYTNCTSF